MGFITTQAFMPTWAWRTSFALGSLVSVAGFFIRRNTAESLEFVQAKTTVKNIPLVTVWNEDKNSFFLSLSTGLINGVLSYTLFSFSCIYLTKYMGHTLSQGMFYHLFGVITHMCLCPLFGSLSDKISPVNSLKLGGRLSLFMPLIAFFLLQMNSGIFIIMGQILLGTFVASFGGPGHYFLQTLFPTNNRYTGVSFGFTIGIAITGGSTPLILTYLLNTYSNLYIPAIYLSIWGALWLVVLGYFYPKIRAHHQPKIILKRAA